MGDDMVDLSRCYHLSLPIMFSAERVLDEKAFARLLPFVSVPALRAAFPLLF